MTVIDAEIQRKNLLDRENLCAALEESNLPSLVMVLYQLTGDERWLQDPYRPSTPVGMDDHDSGGFPDAVQHEIRVAAAEALTSWAEGTAASVPAPSGDVLLAMLGSAVGEPVDKEYEEMFATRMGFREDRQIRDLSGPLAAQPDFSVLIIGAGISGLGSATALLERGIPFRIVEKAKTVGGVWRDNRYPGAGVDTPTYLYSFKNFRRSWDRNFAKRDEVMEYLQDYADSNGITPLVEFDTEVASCSFDEATQRWTVVLDRGGATETISVSAIISAVGLFATPSIPALPGMDTFEGPVFHSANWPEDVDLAGKRVAVVGSGASAMQIVPNTVHVAAHLDVYQRTPQWIVPCPKVGAPVADGHNWLSDNAPFYFDWYRFRLSWMYNDKLFEVLQIDPGWESTESINATNERHRRFLVRYIEGELEGRPDLIEKSVPDYPPYGKRPLMDNGWYKAIREPNVDLITRPVAALSATSVVDDQGTARPADVVVLSTGFQTQRYLSGLPVFGRGGVSLHDQWEDDNPSAYLGMMTKNFPNFFILYGPATNGAGGSFLSLAEQETRYVLSLIEHLLVEGFATVEPRADVHDEYNRSLDEAHSRMVWSHPGVRSYTKNSRGRVVVNYPWRKVDYWRKTYTPNLDEYVLEPRAGA